MAISGEVDVSVECAGDPDIIAASLDFDKIARTHTKVEIAIE